MFYRKTNDNHISQIINTAKLKNELRNSSSDQIKDLCLEDEMTEEQNRRTLTLANLEKEKTRCLLRNLKEELKQVLASNKLLPEPLQFSDDYFQSDERINNSIIEEEQSKMNKLRLKLAFNYEKSLLTLKNIKNYFVDNILTNKFAIKAILYGCFFIYYCLYLYFKYNIYRTDKRVKTIYHKMENNSIFINLVNEFLSKKHPKRR